LTTVSESKAAAALPWSNWSKVKTGPNEKLPSHSSIITIGTARAAGQVSLTPLAGRGIKGEGFVNWNVLGSPQLRDEASSSPRPSPPEEGRERRQSCGDNEKVRAVEGVSLVVTTMCTEFSLTPLAGRGIKGEGFVNWNVLGSPQLRDKASSPRPSPPEEERERGRANLFFDLPRK
jgi:hypothetical protein